MTAHTKLFPRSRPLSRRSRSEMSSHLRSWRALAPVLHICVNVEYLRGMLQAERDRLARPQIMKRIIARLGTLERTRLYEALNITK